MFGGKAILVIGGTGSGKTTWIKKNIVSQVDATRLLVNDVNAEYTEYGLAEINPEEPEQFARLVSVSTEIVAVFEEATIFYSTRGNDQLMRKILVGKRHRNNVIVLVFHSIRAIPHYIFDLINYVVLFRTADDEQLVADRYPMLYNANRKINHTPHLCNQQLLFDNETTVPYEIVKIS